MVIIQNLEIGIIDSQVFTGVIAKLQRFEVQNAVEDWRFETLLLFEDDMTSFVVEVDKLRSDQFFVSVVFACKGIQFNLNLASLIKLKQLIDSIEDAASPGLSLKTPELIVYEEIMHKFYSFEAVQIESMLFFEVIIGEIKVNIKEMIHHSGEQMVLSLKNIVAKPMGDIEEIQQEVIKRNRIGKQKFVEKLSIEQTELKIRIKDEINYETVLMLELVEVTLADQFNAARPSFQYTKISAKVPLLRIQFTLTQLKFIGKMIKQLITESNVTSESSLDQEEKVCKILPQIDRQIYKKFLRKIYLANIEVEMEGVLLKLSEENLATIYIGNVYLSLRQVLFQQFIDLSVGCFKILDDRINYNEHHSYLLDIAQIEQFRENFQYMKWEKKMAEYYPTQIRRNVMSVLDLHFINRNPIIKDISAHLGITTLQEILFRMNPIILLLKPVFIKEIYDTLTNLLTIVKKENQDSKDQIQLLQSQLSWRESGYADVSLKAVIRSVCAIFFLDRLPYFCLRTKNITTSLLMNKYRTSAWLVMNSIAFVDMQNHPRSRQIISNVSDQEISEVIVHLQMRETPRGTTTRVKVKLSKMLINFHLRTVLDFQSLIEEKFAPIFDTPPSQEEKKSENARLLAPVQPEVSRFRLNVAVVRSTLKMQQNALVPQYFMLDFKHLWFFNEGSWKTEDSQHQCIEAMSAQAVNDNTLNFTLHEYQSKDIYNCKITQVYLTNKKRDRVLEIPYLGVNLVLGEPMKIKITEFTPQAEIGKKKVRHITRFNFSDNDFQVFMRMLQENFVETPFIQVQQRLDARYILTDDKILVDVNFRDIWLLLRTGQDDFALFEIQRLHTKVKMPYGDGMRVRVSFDDVILRDVRPDTYLAYNLRCVMLPKYYSKNMVLEEQIESHEVIIDVDIVNEKRMNVKLEMENYAILAIPDFFLTIFKQFVQKGLGDQNQERYMIIETVMDYLPELKVEVNLKNIGVQFRESLTRLKNNQFELNFDMAYKQLIVGDIMAIGLDHKNIELNLYTFQMDNIPFSILDNFKISATMTDIRHYFKEIFYTTDIDVKFHGQTELRFNFNHINTLMRIAQIYQILLDRVEEHDQLIDIQNQLDAKLQEQDHEQEKEEGPDDGGLGRGQALQQSGLKMLLTSAPPKIGSLQFEDKVDELMVLGGGGRLDSRTQYKQKEVTPPLLSDKILMSEVLSEQHIDRKSIFEKLELKEACFFKIRMGVIETEPLRVELLTDSINSHVLRFELLPKTVEAKIKETQPQDFSIIIDANVEYFNSKNCAWEPLLQPLTLRLGAEFSGPLSNHILVEVSDINLNISPQIVELLNNVQLSIGKVQKGKFVKYFMINDTGFSIEFNSSYRNRMRRLRNKATYKIQNMQLKQLLNKKYSSLMDIQINYFIKKMAKNIILKKLLEQEYNVEKNQTFGGGEVEDSYLSSVDLAIIFTGLVSPQATNSFIYKHLFQFDKLMHMNMDMDGVHFNLLSLESEFKEEEKETKNALDNLTRFSAHRRKTMYFASKLKSQHTLSQLETPRRKQTEVVDLGGGLNTNVGASSWLLVTDIQTDIELVSKHIHLRTPLQVKNNLNIPMTILLTTCLSLPDGDQASRQIYYREEVHPAGMFCIPLQFMHKAVMYITLKGVPLVPLFKEFSQEQKVPDIVNFHNINIRTFAEQSRWYISRPIQIQDHKFKLKSYFEGIELINYAPDKKPISIAAILDWTDFQHVHYSESVTKANRSGRPDCKVFKDFVLILSAPLVVSNKLTKRARIKLFESKSNGTKEVKLMNRDGYTQREVYSLANRSEHEFDAIDSDQHCQAQFMLDSGKNKQFLPSRDQLSWKNKFLSIKMEDHGWSKAVPVNFLIPKNAKKQTYQIALHYQSSRVYITAEVQYHSQGCCFVTFFSPFLVFNDTHYPLQLIESHMMKWDRLAKGMKVDPKERQKKGDLLSIKKHYHMLLFSKKYNKVKLKLTGQDLTPFSKRFCLSKTFTDGHVTLQAVTMKQGAYRGYELGIDTPAVATMMRSKVLTVRYKYVLLNYCDFPISLKQEQETNEEKCITVAPFGFVGLEWIDSHKNKKLQAKIVPLLGQAHINYSKKLKRPPRFTLPQLIREESADQETKLNSRKHQPSQFKKNQIGAHQTDKSFSQIEEQRGDDKSKSLHIEEKNEWSAPFIISKVADFTIFPGFFRAIKQYIHVSVQEQSDGTFSIILAPGRFNLLGIVNRTEFAVQVNQEDTDKMKSGILLEPECEQIDYPWPDNTIPLNLELQIETKKIQLQMNSPKVFKDVKIKYEDIVSEVTLARKCVYRGQIFLSLYGEGFGKARVFVAFNRLYYQFIHRERKRRYQMLHPFHGRCNLALIKRNQNLLEIRLDQNTTLKGLNTIQTQEVFDILENAKKRINEDSIQERTIQMRLEPKFQQIVLVIRDLNQNLEIIEDKRRESFLGEGAAIRVNFNLSLIGISLIDETPQELFYLSMKRIKGEVKFSGDGRFLRVKVEKIQMDNHIPHCNFKVALSSLQRKEQPLNKVSINKSKYALVLEVKQKNVDEQSEENKQKKRESSMERDKLRKSKGGIKEMVQFGENINRFKLRQYNYIYLELVRVTVADFEIRMEYKQIGPLIKFFKSISNALANESENDQLNQNLGFLQTFNRSDEIGVVVQNQGSTRYKSLLLYAFDQKEKRERSAALPQDVREQSENDSRLRQSLTDKRVSTFSLRVVEDIPVVQIKRMNVSSYSIYLSYSASPTFAGNDNAEKYTKAILKDSGLALATIQDSRLHFKKFEIRQQFLPQDQLITSLSSHYKKSLMYQLYKVVGSIELIGKPFQYFDSIAEEVEEIQDIEESDISNQKRCSRYTRGCCRILCGIGASFFGSGHSITKAGANLISPLTFDDTYRRYRFEQMTKPKHSALDALGSAFYLLFLGIAFAFLGIFYFPCSSCQKGKRKTFGEWLLALIRGVAGFLVKLALACIDFVSYLAKFLSLIFKGKKFKRNNPFRKKRVFRNGMFKIYNKYDAEAQELIKNTRIEFGLEEEVFLTALSQQCRVHRSFHALFISSRGRFDRIILIRNKSHFISKEIIRQQIEKVQISENQEYLRIYLRNQTIPRPLAKVSGLDHFDIKEFSTKETKYFTEL